jgi:16S rRNA processing protein RimM
MPWESMIVVGRIIRPQGRRGEVVVAPETDFAEARFAPGSALAIERDGAVGSLRVVESRFAGGRAVVLFEGVESIDDAEALRGHDLRIAAGDLHELPPGAYYVHDLAGCAVVVAGAEVGRVERVEFGTGAPLLVVKTGRGEALIPFVAGICRAVDLARREIVVEPPEGLLDVNVPSRGRG